MLSRYFSRPVWSPLSCLTKLGNVHVLASSRPRQRSRSSYTSPAPPPLRSVNAFGRFPTVSVLSSATSPPQRAVLRNSSLPQVYHGSMVTHDLFSDIFGFLDAGATLRTQLVVAKGTPTPGVLSILENLPLTVDIYRVTTCFRPST